MRGRTCECDSLFEIVLSLLLYLDFRRLWGASKVANPTQIEAREELHLAILYRKLGECVMKDQHIIASLAKKESSERVGVSLLLAAASLLGTSLGVSPTTPSDLMVTVTAGSGG